MKTIEIRGSALRLQEILAKFLHIPQKKNDVIKGVDVCLLNFLVNDIKSMLILISIIYFRSIFYLVTFCFQKSSSF